MRPCPICGQAAGVRIGDLHSTFHAPLVRSDYELAHCQSCDVVYLSPLPLEEDLNTIYSATQFDYYTPESIKPVVEFYCDRMRALDAALGYPKKLSVLEIGAGPAWMSRAAKTVDPESTAVAQDVSSEMAEKCPWVDRYLVDSADSPEIDQRGPYNVISMTHVFEHLPDPVGMLQRLKRVCNGLIFITAPHRPVKWAGTIEEWRKYSYNHVPAHLQYFSKLGMEAAAQRAGLRLRYWDASAEEGQAFEAWLE